MEVFQKHIVINFDLGLRGDYSSLYSWLDSKNAIECGNATAAFAMNFSKDDFQTIYDELKKDLEKNVVVEKTDRIYMIATDSDCSMKGAFLFGGRKRATWEGYSIKKTNEPDNFS